MSNDRILQIRTDALVAEHIYSKKLNTLNTLANTISTLTIIIPIILSAIILTSQNSQYKNEINAASVLITAILLSLTIGSLIFKTDQKRENYIIGRRSNIYIANESLRLLTEQDSNLTWFYNYLVETDSKDLENVGYIDEDLKKEAYRNALKKLIPGRNDVTCAVCRASPFIYVKGSCQVCGNEPKEI